MLETLHNVLSLNSNRAALSGALDQNKPYTHVDNFEFDDVCQRGEIIHDCIVVTLIYQTDPSIHHNIGKGIINGVLRCNK